MILERIVEAKREEMSLCRSRLPLRELRGRIAGIPPVRDFLGAVQREGAVVNLIAEIKRASPSRGLIRPDFNPRKIARIYEEAGAQAISVLTDEGFFRGHPEHLRHVRQVTRLPLLRKDFIIDDYQIYQSRLLGADAVLLIAALLEQSRLVDYLGLAGELGLAALVEVHTPDELYRVLETGAPLVGINNRDLHTFKTDLEVTFKLLPLVPEGTVVVSESGIHTQMDVARLARAGVDAVLVGEALMRARDIGAAVAELMGRCGKRDGDVPGDNGRREADA